MKLLQARRPHTVCPSEVARKIDAETWRPWVLPVREAAARLASRGRLDVLQKGHKVEPSEARGPIRLRLAAAGDAYRGIDFSKHPERYRVGRGERGVLTAEPYKSRLLPLWRFKTEQEAKASSQALLAEFLRFKKQHDFVGMDMARKFVQMGYTRARRYANHRSGRKYDADGKVLSRTEDPEKARAAAAFHRIWQQIEADQAYRAVRARWSKAHVERQMGDGGRPRHTSATDSDG